MKVIVKVTVEVDRDAYANEYHYDAKAYDIRQDVKDSVSLTVKDYFGSQPHIYESVEVE